jgi:5'-nucleotidase
MTETCSKPHFLLINDDGISSIGMKYLWESLKDFADLTIIAPDKQRSGSGAAMTLDGISIYPVDWMDGTKAYKVSGTPVDCVKAGLSILLEKKPTMIISGINHGTNAGRTLLFSGTVGAVIEGSLRNIPGIAFSYWKYDTDSFSHIKKYIWPIVKHLSSKPLPAGSFFNVNFPPHEEGEIKGFKVVPHGESNWIETPKKQEHPEGVMQYEMYGVWKDDHEKEGTDVFYLKQGYITAAPIQVAQLTDFNILSSEKEGFEKAFEDYFKLS